MFSDRFPKDLLDEVIPLVERSYRVYADADHRAIAGLSMGGGQALSIGLTHPDMFHWVLGFSAAVGGQFLPPDKTFEPVLADPAAANKKFHLVWISCGKQDFLHQANQELAEAFKAKGVNVMYKETEGAHVWSVWRKNLNETAAMLFR